MAMVENTALGLKWFWQTEHNGSWYWELSNVSSRNNYADDGLDRLVSSLALGKDVRNG